MKTDAYFKFSRREREMMDVIYAKGRATAADVRTALKSPPSYSAVRATLRILEEKGHVRHEYDGPSYVYLPVRSSNDTSRSALRQLLDTFFSGSAEHAVAALLDVANARLSAQERERLLKMIRRAEEEGR